MEFVFAVLLTLQTHPRSAHLQSLGQVIPALGAGGCGCVRAMARRRGAVRVLDPGAAVGRKPTAVAARRFCTRRAGSAGWRRPSLDGLTRTVRGDGLSRTVRGGSITSSIRGAGLRAGQGYSSPYA